MNEVKSLAGVLNYDDPDMALALNNHADAQNIRFTGTQGNLLAENIEGNTLIPNPYLPTTGINTTIGKHFDDIKNRVFFFNYNSLGLHGIYILNYDNTFTVLLANSILAFDPNVPISSIDILYNDAIDGDILYFLDSLKHPTKLNIPRYVANTYNPVKRNFLKVIKAPPPMPIKATYENDFTIAVNNLKNSLFQFIYRFVYDDNDKSVWSSGSIVPLPFEPFDTTIDNNKYYNSRIALYLQTGDVNIKKIEIAFSQSSNGTISDYYLITSLDKSVLSIPSNDFYKFVFYNDGQYSLIYKKEQVLLFDYVPQEADAQVLLNGNVPAYANIKEGYNLTNGIMSSGAGTLHRIQDINGVLFFGVQGNDDSLGTGDLLTLYLTGVGTNDSNNNPISLDNNNGLIFNVLTYDVNNNPINFTATTTTSDINSIFNIIQAAATFVGFAYISRTTNSITFSLTGYKLLTATIGFDRNSGTLNTTLAALYSTAFESNYDVGIIYYDEDGRTNSVITTAAANLKTISAQTGDDSLLPYNQLGISHIPPIWAVYYHLVISPNLTYQKRLDWVSKQAFTDNQLNSGTKYAYVDISNIIEYNQSLTDITGQATQGVVGYDFAVGDRIRFLKRFPLTGGTVQLSAKQYDYEIIGVDNVVIANGIGQVGTFIKIKYPASDIGSDFAFIGDNFQNYQIAIYQYAKHTELNKTSFFEIGHRRKIGNAGTPNAYHIGNVQIQVPNAATPAIEAFVAADYFARYRTVPSGNTYQITIGGGNVFTYSLSTFKTSPSPIIDIVGQYSIHAQQSNLNSGFGVMEYPTIADSNYHFYNASSTISRIVRIRMTISQYSDAGSFFQLYAKRVFSGQTVQDHVLIIDDQAVNTTGTPRLYKVDVTLTVPPLNALFLLTAGSLGVNKVVSGSNMTFDVVREIPIPVMDKSFSDLNNIKLNSYSRAVLVDENARQETKATLLRFAEPAQQGTNINMANRFYPNNTDEFDRNWGGVVRMMISGRQLIIFQYANTGSVGIYAKFIKDNSGSQNLITTDTIITPNNIQYYEGGFGIRNQPLSLTKNGYQFYFADDIRGMLCRLSQDGVTAISELYKVQTWAGANIPKYQTDSDYQFGGKSKILSCYNQLKNRHGEVIFILQKGSNNGTVTKQQLSMVFDEQRNAFTTSYKFNPDQIICAGNRLFTFYNGNVYEHNDLGANRRFYGEVYYPSLTLVFNKDVILRKVFKNISYISNKTWVSDTNGDIITSELNDQTGLPQISSLIAKDYTRRGNHLDAAFLQDANSKLDNKLALLEGDVLNGLFITVKLTYKGSDSAYIYLPTVLSQEDKENLKNP